MNWKFWQKKEAAPQDAPGQSRPKDIPEAVGRHMVVDLGIDPDWVWTLKAVTRRREENRNIKDFRIFSPATANAAGMKVRNFNSLEASPDLILFDGWINTKTRQLELIAKTTEKAA